MKKVMGYPLDIPGGIAQMGEHLPCKQGVVSSNLTISIHQKKGQVPYWR